MEEIVRLIKEYLNRHNNKNIVFVSDEQKQYLKENKGLLFEYYSQISNPRVDGKILEDFQVWVYGNDRKDFTPHCHFFNRDKSIEVEISLIDWNVIRVKNGNPSKSQIKPFFKWLNAKHSRDRNQTNKLALFIAWDNNNPENDLLGFIERNDIEINDKELVDYINNQIGEQYL